jgi:rubrerythrin
LSSSSFSILENNCTTKTNRKNNTHIASSPLLSAEKEHRHLKNDVGIPAPTTNDGRVSISSKVKTNSLLKKLGSGASFDDPDSATTFKSEASSTVSLTYLSSESKTPLKGHRARLKKKYSQELNQKEHASISKKPKRMILTCTACNLGRDAEERHPVLHVPICGACKDNFKNRDKARLEKGGQINEVSCVWCGLEDDKRFVLCDFCAFAFCTDCIHRNIGQAEAEELLQPSHGNWACYHCSPTLVFECILLTTLV